MNQNKAIVRTEPGEFEKKCCNFKATPALDA